MINVNQITDYNILVKIANLIGLHPNQIKEVNQVEIDLKPGNYEIITTDGSRKVLYPTALNNI